MSKQDEFIVPIHFRRFITATQDWSDEEVGCYFRLLMYQWQKRCIPKDIGRLKRIAESVERNYWIVEKKFLDKDFGLQNADMEEIRHEKNAYSKAQSDRRTKYLESKKSTGTQPGNNQNLTGDVTEGTTKNQPALELGLGLELVNSNEVIFPFADQKFSEMWLLWKRYKKEQFKFVYKSPISEQGALKKIGELSDGKLDVALAIIQQSIDNSWKGFFELKDNTNGKQHATRQNKDKLDRIIRGEL